MTRPFLTIATVALASNLVFGAETLDEKQFQKLMKEVGDAAKTFKANIDNKDHVQVQKHASRIAEIYQQMSPFWQQRKADKAAKWSDESSVAAKALAISAQEQDWDKVKANIQGLMKNCKNCHEAHREKLDDGSYRIKL